MTTKTTDRLDHTFNLVKTKQGYRIQSRCSYPDTKLPKALKLKLESNYDKLEKIEQAIRYHYFTDVCKHENNEKCRASILNEVITITGYEPRSPIAVGDKRN